MHVKKQKKCDNVEVEKPKRRTVCAISARHYRIQIWLGGFYTDSFRLSIAESGLIYETKATAYLLMMVCAFFQSLPTSFSENGTSGDLHFR